MTQEQFNFLPMMLSPRDMKDITGLNKNGLKVLRESNPQIVLRQCGALGRGKFQYSKPQVAKLLGFKP
jgi:hypothetical protein